MISKALRHLFTVFRSQAFTGILVGFCLLTGTAMAAAKGIDWESLNLTQQQDSQLTSLEQSWGKKHNEVTAQIQSDTQELQKMLPNGDPQKIRVIQNRISTNKMYLMNESVDVFLKKRDLLTPPQRVQLQKMFMAPKNGQVPTTIPATGVN